MLLGRISFTMRLPFHHIGVIHHRELKNRSYFSASFHKIMRSCDFAFLHPSVTVAQDQDLFTPQSILQEGDFNVNFYSTFGGQSRICISFMEVHDFHFYWTGRTKADYVKYLVLLLN